MPEHKANMMALVWCVCGELIGDSRYDQDDMDLTWLRYHYVLVHYYEIRFHHGPNHCPTSKRKRRRRRRHSNTLPHLNAFMSDPKNEDFFSFSLVDGPLSLLSLSRRLLCGRSRCSSGVLLSAWRRDECREPVPSPPASRDDDGLSERSRGLSPLLCERRGRSPLLEPEAS